MTEASFCFRSIVLVQLFNFNKSSDLPVCDVERLNSFFKFSLFCSISLACLNLMIRRPVKNVEIFAAPSTTIRLRLG